MPYRLAVSIWLLIFRHCSCQIFKCLFYFAFQHICACLLNFSKGLFAVSCNFSKGLFAISCNFSKGFFVFGLQSYKYFFKRTALSHQFLVMTCVIIAKAANDNLAFIIAFVYCGKGNLCSVGYRVAIHSATYAREGDAFDASLSGNS